jgi:hypothetical protein
MLLREIAVLDSTMAFVETLEGNLPRLLMVGEPGSAVGRPEVEWAREHGRDLTIASVGAGTHFLPEDCSTAIADTLRTWLSVPVEGRPTRRPVG